jgi:hypothetical protein
MCICLCTCIRLPTYVRTCVCMHVYVHVRVSLTISSVYIPNEHVDFSSIPCLGNIQHLQRIQHIKKIRIVAVDTIENTMKATTSGIEDTLNNNANI